MSAKIIAMIPARLGSQRLKEKNLLEIDGEPIVVRAMRKAETMGSFDEVWANSDAERVGELAKAAGINFHRRPAELASSEATSEDFVYEFLQKHPCDYLVQLHSIAPLIKRDEVDAFVKELTTGGHDTLLSGVEEQIQCMMNDEPLNFSKDGMDATQELKPVQRISWSITGWKAASYMKTYEEGGCATFNGKMGFFALSRPSGLVIKYEEDYRMAVAMAAAGLGE